MASPERLEPPASALQSTYSSCFQVCGTAVYFENTGRELEALASWSNALAQIQYHHQHLIPDDYTPINETEELLQIQIRKLEAKCKQRIAVIEARSAIRQFEAERREREAKEELPSRPTTAGKTPDLNFSSVTKRKGKTSAGPSPHRAHRADEETLTRSLQPHPTPPPPTMDPKYSSTRGSAFNPSSNAMPPLSRTASTPAAQSSRSPERRMPRTLRPTAPSKSSSKSRSNVPRLSDTNQQVGATQAATQAWHNMAEKSWRSARADLGLAGKASSEPRLDRLAGPKMTLPDPSSLYPLVSGRDPVPHGSPRAVARHKPREPLPATRGTPSLRSYNTAADERSDRAAIDSLPESEEDSEGPVAYSPIIQEQTGTFRAGLDVPVTPPSDALLPDDYGLLYQNDIPGRDFDEKKIFQELKSLGLDKGAVSQVLREIVHHGDVVHWEDIAGLDAAKLALKETVVYPFLRPDLFNGLREPVQGILLFGPPGTGKTMLATAVATESRSTFFSISASTLMSKYLGDSEKLVRALFAVAKHFAPSIIFIDEIDSILAARGHGEHEATRRLKTEFLIQWSGLARAASGRTPLEADVKPVLVLAATNMPWAIDEAARRRFVRRQYIPLPDGEVRRIQLNNLLHQQKHSLSDEDFEELVRMTDSFSGSDITALAKDAAMGPLRAVGDKLLRMTVDEIRPIQLEDFKASIVKIRPSVSQEGLERYDEWAKKFGESGA
ncbi:AAA-domain-containing protein [Trichodelitschia bisporula]|uniref:AAA-domain-containing protein n=1 Tax=Trichodelitschia bisporula TaxID=703511 RepID=A0A6G1HVD4_9PEZI|nr:AAA-domain-containing protein [Trichodelitschia bisporula]